MRMSCSGLFDLEDVWPDRAFYRPGESAQVCMLVCNRAERPMSVSCWLTLSWLDQELSGERRVLEVQPGWQRLELPLELPGTAVCGDGVDVQVCDEGGRGVRARARGWMCWRTGRRRRVTVFWWILGQRRLRRRWERRWCVII